MTGARLIRLALLATLVAIALPALAPETTSRADRPIHLLLLGRTDTAGHDQARLPLAAHREANMAAAVRRPLRQAAVTFGLTVLAAVAIAQGGFRRGALIAITGALALWLTAAILVRTLGIYLSPLEPTVAAVAVIAAAGWLWMTSERLRALAARERRDHVHQFVSKGLASLIEIRDRSIDHARRTQGYSRLLLRPLARRPEFRDYLTPERIDALSLLAPLHDIGKTKIEDAILNKPGALTDEELAEVRKHPEYGVEKIDSAGQEAGATNPLDLAILQIAKDIVFTHHERWDGTGYPRGLRGREIPLAGRVMAIVDVYEALVEPRPYRRQMPHSEAVALILSGRGTQFDPQVVEAFMTVAPGFAALRSVLPADTRQTMH